MSTIIAHPKEGVLVADRFVLEASCLHKDFSKFDVKLEDKIIITEDKHFAYVFENTQYTELVPVILSFIQRFEAGLVPPDEKPPKFKSLQDGGFSLMIMTKRYHYRYCSDNNMSLSRRNVLWSNHFDGINWCSSLELTAEEIFNVILEDAPTYSTKSYQKVSQKDLKIIPKARVKKEKK